MASEQQRVPTYPVWVGNLKDTVKEKDLRRVFSKHGQVASCKVMEDEWGNSRCFGFVNFYTEVEAEMAASLKQGFKISGVSIKTKGPKQLSQEGHFTPSPPKPEGNPLAGLNFRPLTDCSFFMQGKKCKKGSSCPYRHSDAALSSTVTCPQWVDRNCRDVACPYRHPGGKEKKSDIDAEVVSSSGLELIKCGGRCGNATCAAHFASKEDLTQHIKMSRLLQCRHCRAIFFTDVEYRDHKRSCRGRMNSGSTDVSSDSIDVEELSDSDSTDTETDEEERANQFGGSSHLDKMSKPHKSFDSIHKSASANVFNVTPSKKRHRDRRSSESNTKIKGELALSKLSSPQKAHKGRMDPKSASDFGVNRLPEPNGFGDRDLSTVVPPSGRLLYPGTGGYGVGFDDDIMEYSTSSSEDSYDEEDEGDSDYSPSEMTKLLSLNDQDMYESGGEGEEEEEELNEGEYRRHGMGADTWESNKIHRNTKNDEANKGGSGKSVATVDSSEVKSPHRVKLEPVGVFWDIENCPVPLDKSAFALAAKMRRVFFEGKREAEFMCVCDVTKERKEVTDALHKAQVTLVHVNAIAKNAADDKLRQSLRRFAHTYPAPSTVVLISGDINFSSELTDLRHVHNITIVLVHNPQANEGLKVFAHTLINFDEFLEDVEPPHEPQSSNLPRIVVVKGLPTNHSAFRLSQRLDRISDNCGGKVLRVDNRTGTARILFRTPEWANKALKRMAGEDVFGHKITTSLEPQPPSHAQKHGSQQLRNLAGPALSKTFPPPPQPPPTHHPPVFSSPQPQRPPPMSPQHPQPPYPGFQHHPRAFSPPGPFGPRPPPHPYMSPQAQPPRQPLLSPPHQGGGGQFPPIRPGFPPNPGPIHPYGPPPNRTLVPLPLHTAPPSQIRGPHGKILIFRIPPVPDAGLDRLNGLVVGIRLEACVKAEHLILWHNLSELQVLLRLDFIQTASAMKEDMIRTLCEKNQLRKEVADAFMSRCAESIQNVSRSRQLPWEVTLCGWSPDEEEERVVRSQVVALLRRYPPYYWTKWNTFKQRYSEVYSSAISEMAIHNACRGAVQILGNPGNSQNQVIIVCELSPLVKVVNNQSVINQLQKNIVKLLNLQPEKKIKLLDFVRVYQESNLGVLPVSSSGRLLQDIITSTPNVTMVGVKPSNVYVTLGGKDNGTAAATPQNLPGISAAFVNLLIHLPSGEIPLGQFQQEYQTFYHKSFRVSDYLSGTSKLRDLLEKCSGIKLRDLSLPGGGVQTIVCLDYDKPSTPNVATQARAPGSSATGSVTSAPPEDIGTLSRRFCSLLARFPNNQIPLSQFQQEYQTFFRHSFRVSDYLSEENAGLKDLLQVCDGIKVVNVNLANGRSQALVCRTEDMNQPLPPKSSPTKIQKSASSATVATSTASNTAPPTATTITDARVSPTPDTVPAESVELFKKECIEVLNSLPGRRVYLSKFPEAYYKCKGQIFALSRYKAKKIALLVQAMPDVVRILGDKDNKIMELITDTKKDFENCVQNMLYSMPNHVVTLDRFVSEYEKHSGHRLSHFYGHPRLLKLLEDIPDTVKLKGGGSARPVTLHPRCVFAMDMAQLVAFHPEGLLISKVIPEYKEKFGKDLVVADIGFSKLIRALESIPNVLEISGEGASRKISPRSGPPLVAGAPSPSPTLSLPPLQLLADEIIALLMTTFSNKLSLVMLTKQYNTCFRSDQPLVSKEQLLEAIQKLPNFKITGSGATLYVQHAPPTPERPKGGGSKAKRKSKTSESKEQSEAEEPHVDGKAEPTETSGMELMVQSDESPKIKENIAPIPPTMAPQLTVGSKLATASQPTVESLLPAMSQHAIVSQSTTITQPSVVTQPIQSITVSLTTTVAGPPTAVVPSQEDIEKEDRRLFSETRRLLQLHSEHAMTLAELVEKFRENEEPSQPSAERLYRLLTKFNIKEGGTGGVNPKILQITYIPSSVGDSVIQMGVADCFWKLSMDLAYLFIYHPTPTFSMSVTDLETFYAQCYGRKLIPAIYAAKTIQKLFTWKQVAKVMQFKPDSGMCQLTQASSLRALAALLAELLFCRGGECTTPEDLLELYQHQFGVPLLLEHFGVASVLNLIDLPEIKEVVKLVHVQVEEDSYQFKPVLTPSSLLAEQLRYLLTTHNHCIPMTQVESIYTTTFGIQTHINIADLLKRNKIIQAAPHIVSVIGNNKWMVWAPTGRPYPSRGRKANLLPVHRNENCTPYSGVPITPTEITKTTSSNEEFKAAVTRGATIVAEEIKLLQLKPQPQSTQVSSPHDELVDAPQTFCDVRHPSGNESDVVIPFKSVESVSSGDATTSKDFSTELISKTTTDVIPSSVVIESSVDLPVSTSPSLPKSNGEISAETYGFLEKSLEPELMAELRASGEQHQQREQTLSELLNSKPLSEQAIQLLIHFAKPMSEIDLDDDGDDVGDQVEQAEPDQPFEPVDYLQSGMTPDQVLEEMRKLKEHSGGYLSPEKMEPFLTYFGELSSRELDRLESLEEEKPKSKKGAAKKKRVMAIRFPDKSPAPPSSSGDDPDPYKEQRLYSAELLRDKLPVAPDFENMSDSSDSDGSCPRPLEREEYIQTLLERGIPNLTDEDIIRAAQTVGKDVNRKPDDLAASTKVDWPFFEKDGEERLLDDLPKPLLSPSELGHAITCQLFDDSPHVLDQTSRAATKRNTAE